MRSIALLALGAVSLPLAACSNPKEASKGNFEHAINAWIEKNPPCLNLPDSTVTPDGAGDAAFPRYVDASPVTARFAIENRQRRQAPFDALVDAGLMKVQETRIPVKMMFGGAKEVPVRAYDLTDAGKKAVSSEGEKSAFGPPRQKLCYGTPTVDEIVQFTEPADALGVKMSRVTYRYHLKDLPDWAQNAKMRAAFPRLEKESAEGLDASAVVVLTNEGWVHEAAARP